MEGGFLVMSGPGPNVRPGLRGCFEGVVLVLVRGCLGLVTVGREVIGPIGSEAHL